MLKHLIFITVIISWTSIVLLIRSHGKHPHKTVSGHASANRKYHFRFGTVEILLALATLYFLEQWYVDAFSLPTNFRIIVGLSSAGLIIAAIIPQTKSWQFIVHECAAYTMAFGMLAQLCIILSATSLSVPLQFLLSASCMYMAFVWIALIFFLKKFGHLTLYLQLGYFVTYHISLLATTYLTR
jgi:hypothetical protein